MTAADELEQAVLNVAFVAQCLEEADRSEHGFARDVVYVTRESWDDLQRSLKAWSAASERALRELKRDREPGT